MLLFAALGRLVLINLFFVRMFCRRAYVHLLSAMVNPRIKIVLVLLLLSNSQFLPEHVLCCFTTGNAFAFYRIDIRSSIVYFQSSFSPKMIVFFFTKTVISLSYACYNFLCFIVDIVPFFPTKRSCTYGTFHCFKQIAKINQFMVSLLV